MSMVFFQTVKMLILGLDLMRRTTEQSLKFNLFFSIRSGVGLMTLLEMRINYCNTVLLCGRNKARINRELS